MFIGIEFLKSLISLLSSFSQESFYVIIRRHLSLQCVEIWPVSFVRFHHTPNSTNQQRVLASMVGIEFIHVCVQLVLINFSWPFIIDILNTFTISQLKHSQPQSIHVFLVLVVIEIQILLLEVWIHRWRLVLVSLARSNLAVLHIQNLFGLKWVWCFVNEFWLMIVCIIGNIHRLNVSMSHVFLFQISIGINLLIENMSQFFMTKTLTIFLSLLKLSVKIRSRVFIKLFDDKEGRTQLRMFLDRIVF